MKHTLKTSLLILVAFTQLNAQDSTRKIQVGIDLAYAKPNYYKKGGFFPSLTLSTSKQVIFAGLGLVYYDYAHPQPMFGIQAGYRIYPAGRNKKFNLFFEGNIHYVQGTLKDKVPSFLSDYYWISGSGSRTTNLVTLDNYFGFGFTWNITKNIHMNSNVGFSAGLYKEDYIYTYPDGKTWSSKGRLVVRNFETPSTIFKLGLSYDLLSFKRKIK